MPTVNANNVFHKILTPFHKAGSLIFTDGRKGDITEVPFTRAGGGSTTNQNGVIVEQAANVPAIVKRPGECARVAFRPARTRVIAKPETLNDPVWQKFISGTGVQPVVTDNYGTYKGRPTSRLQFEIGALDNASASYIYQTVTPTNGIQKIYARSLTGGNLTLTVLGAAANDTIVTTEWQSFEFVSAGAGSLRIGINDVSSTTPDLVADIEVAMCNWEGTGAYSTDFIPGNETGTQTRPADVSIETGLKAKGYLGATEGSIGGEFWADQLMRDDTSNSLYLGGASASEKVYLARGTGSSFMNIVVYDGSSNLAVFNTVQSYNKWLFGWDGSGWYLKVNGATVSSGPEVFTFPTDNLSISGSGGLFEMMPLVHSLIKLPDSTGNTYTTI